MAEVSKNSYDENGKRKGFMSRIRRAGRRTKPTVEKREPSPPLVVSLPNTDRREAVPSKDSTVAPSKKLEPVPSKENMPIASKDTDVRNSASEHTEGTVSIQEGEEPEGKYEHLVRMLNNKNLPMRGEVELAEPPSAREAAFGGPVRYDWIDIETSAAIKVQAAFRRIKVMSEMEKRGETTAAIRNRARRLEALGCRKKKDVEEEDPATDICTWCGIGFAFGDPVEEDEAARQYRKAQYEKRKQEAEQREAKLRSGFINRLRNQRKNKNGVEEAYEIVE